MKIRKMGKILGVVAVFAIVFGTVRIVQAVQIPSALIHDSVDVFYGYEDPVGNFVATGTVIDCISGCADMGLSVTENFQRGQISGVAGPNDTPVVSLWQVHEKAFREDSDDADEIYDRTRFTWTLRNDAIDTNIRITSFLVKANGYSPISTKQPVGFDFGPDNVLGTADDPANPLIPWTYTYNPVIDNVLYEGFLHWEAPVAEGGIFQTSTNLPLTVGVFEAVIDGTDVQVGIDLLGIDLRDASNNPTQVITDAVWVGTAPVPEPASLLLLGSGLAGFGLIRRRRSKGNKKTDSVNI